MRETEFDSRIQRGPVEIYSGGRDGKDEGEDEKLPERGKLLRGRGRRNLIEFLRRVLGESIKSEGALDKQA